jgi:CelD/BcsL family acetyltransferase involved in cellulose biosynthesis
LLGSAAGLRRFYERFAPVALRAGWLRLYALRLDGAIRAVQYGYAYAHTFYQLQEGYDPEAPEGIGNVLREHAFKASIAEGLRAYDFLGEYTEHKRRWGAARRDGFDLLLGRPGLKNRTLFTRPVWPTGRFLRENSPPEPDRTPGRPEQPARATLPPVTASLAE